MIAARGSARRHGFGGNCRKRDTAFRNGSTTGTTSIPGGSPTASSTSDNFASTKNATQLANASALAGVKMVPLAGGTVAVPEPSAFAVLAAAAVVSGLRICRHRAG